MSIFRFVLIKGMGGRKRGIQIMFQLTVTAFCAYSDIGKISFLLLYLLIEESEVMCRFRRTVFSMIKVSRTNTLCFEECYLRIT